MVSMHISLPELMKDYVQDRIDSGQYASASDYIRDLIRRDQGGVASEEHWLRSLGATIADSVRDMNTGADVDLDAACDAVLARLDLRNSKTNQ